MTSGSVTPTVVMSRSTAGLITFSKGAGNRYVINLDKKTATLYSNGAFINENPIIDHTTKDGLLYVTMLDTELPNNKKVKSNN